MPCEPLFYRYLLHHPFVPPPPLRPLLYPPSIASSISAPSLLPLPAPSPLCSSLSSSPLPSVYCLIHFRPFPCIVTSSTTALFLPVVLSFTLRLLPHPFPPLPLYRYQLHHPFVPPCRPLLYPPSIASSISAPSLLPLPAAPSLCSSL